MDKSKLLDQCGALGEDRTLLARVLDRAKQASERNIPAATDFLSPAQQAQAADLLHAAGIPETAYIRWGGYDGAERAVLLFLPDWMDPSDAGTYSPIRCLRAAFRKEENLTHRDFLGSLMGMGIVREKIGDILVGPDSADVLVGRLLRAMAAVTELRLVSAEGGSKGNAIPTAAAAVVTVADGSAARKAAETLAAEMKKEYRIADPGLTVAVETVETKSLPMDEVTTGKALCMLTCLPNGVQAMSMDIPGLVQTSLNVGILKCGDDELTAVCSVRSSVASQKQMVRDRLRCLTEQLGGRVDVVGDYPAWESLPDSPLRERMIEVYREQYGKEPVVETVHAGLECGLLGEKLPGLDCVSFGPDLTDIHTPRERMHIASVQRTWKLLCEVLKRSK